MSQKQKRWRAQLRALTIIRCAYCGVSRNRFKGCCNGRAPKPWDGRATRAFPDWSLGRLQPVTTRIEWGPREGHQGVFQ